VAGRKVEDEREARRCLAAAKRAGLGAGEWARNRGIDGRSLHAWQLAFERRGQDSSARPRPKKRRVKAKSALVELVAAGPSVPSGRQGQYVLEVGGARLEFGDGASVATLRRVLEALRPC